jgi:hypothetical protein
MVGPKINGTFSLVVGIVSAVGNVDKRAAVRESWGFLPGYSGQSFGSNVCRPPAFKDIFQETTCPYYGGTLVLFIIGVARLQQQQMNIELEAAVFGDIIQVRVEDTYKNVLYKLLHFYDWVQTTISAKFVMKVRTGCPFRSTNFKFRWMTMHL